MKQPQERFMTVLGGYKLDRHNHCELVREYIKPSSGDTGADPIGDGKFRMVPSGDIVDLAERNKRLAK